MHTTIVNVATDTVTLFHIRSQQADRGVGITSRTATQEHDLCESGDATGIGDIVVRGKLGLPRRSVAAGGRRRRAPAHRRRADLLGTGATQVKAFLIAGFGRQGQVLAARERWATRSPATPTCSASCPTSSTTRWASTRPCPRGFTLTADLVGRTLIDAAAPASCATRTSTTATWATPIPRSRDAVTAPSLRRRRRHTQPAAGLGRLEVQPDRPAADLGQRAASRCPRTTACRTTSRPSSRSTTTSSDGRWKQRTPGPRARRFLFGVLRDQTDGQSGNRAAGKRAVGRLQLQTDGHVHGNARISD